jgi:hypothetical protein
MKFSMKGLGKGELLIPVYLVLDSVYRVIFFVDRCFYLGHCFVHFSVYGFVLHLCYLFI